MRRTDGGKRDGGCRLGEMAKLERPREMIGGVVGYEGEDQGRTIVVRGSGLVLFPRIAVEGRPLVARPVGLRIVLEAEDWINLLVRAARSTVCRHQQERGPFIGLNLERGHDDVVVVGGWFRRHGDVN